MFTIRANIFTAFFLITLLLLIAGTQAQIAVYNATGVIVPPTNSTPTVSLPLPTQTESGAGSSVSSAAALFAALITVSVNAP